jgi:putative transposase
MTSKTLAQLLSDLDVRRSFSRPQISNDNPFSESTFKTMKYSSMFPRKFEKVEAVVEFGNQYFDWYNNEHRHSGIAYLTPAQVHAGEADAELTLRHKTKLAAWAEHPERFVRAPPRRTSGRQH